MAGICANEPRNSNRLKKEPLTKFWLIATFLVALVFLPKTTNATITYVSGSSLDTTGVAQGESSPVYSTASLIEPGHLFILILGMRPSLENRGATTDPAGWTRIASTTGGGYGTTLATDTGNMHIFAFAKVADGSERDKRLAIPLTNDNVTWANIFRLSNTLGSWDIATTTGEDTSGDGTCSITFGANPGVTAGDYIIGAEVIPTDIQTTAQYSSHTLTQTGVTFGTVTEAGEADSVTGNDIGGVLWHAPVNSGTGSAAPQWSSTCAGATPTNYRGPGVFIRAREIAAPSAPTIYQDDGGANQIAFSHSRQNDTTPIVRVSATHTGNFDRFQVEFNTQADFLGTSYTETFSNTYSSGTQYNLQTTGSLGLPTTDGATYYIRARASANSGSHWGTWSGSRMLSDTISYTYKSSGSADWFQTTGDQFLTGTTTNTRVSTTTPNSIDLTRLPYVAGFTAGATENPGTSITLVKPVGVNVGDLLLIIVGNDAGNSTVQWDSGTNRPAGFTFINESGNTTSDSHSAAFYRIADGTEQTSTTTTSVTSEDIFGHYLRVTGVDTTTPIDVTGADSCNAVGTSCAITSVNTTVAHTLAFYLHSFDGSDGNPFGISGAGWVKSDGINSTGSTQSDANGASGSWGTRVSPSTGATGNATVSSVVSDGFTGFQFAVRPENVTTGTILSPVIDFDVYDGASGWNQAFWSETETIGTVSVRVLGSNSSDCDTQVIAPTATSPIDLSSLTSTGAGQLHNRICLEATLADSNGSPLLNDWGVSWTEGGIQIGAASATGGSFSTTLNIGSAGNNRLVTVFAMSEAEATTALTGVTVDGKNCHFVDTAFNDDVSADNRTELWYCDEDDLGASNGSVTVAITGGTTAANWAVHAQVFTGVGQTGPTDFDVDETSITPTQTTTPGAINVAAGGLVVMGASNGQGALTVNSYTSPLTEQTSADPASADGVTAAGKESSAQTGKTYQITWSAAPNRSSGIVATWQSVTDVNAPTVTTNFAVPGFNAASIHGTKTGGNNATQHGFAYSTDSALSTGVSTTTLGTLDGNHAFSSFITGLSSDQTYYYRAYATNSSGTGFGSIKSFATGNSSATRNLRIFDFMKFLNGLIKLNQQ